MDLSRYYFISTDLADLDTIEAELERGGIAAPQIHVLTRENAKLRRYRNLHGVPSVMKRNIVRSAMKGAVVGVILALMALFISYAAGLTDTAAGWFPSVFLAIILLGFCTWFGGLHGLRLPNEHFLRFQDVLDDGKHVLFVDIEHDQHATLKEVCDKHPSLEWAGTGMSAPDWFVRFERATSHWWYWRLWREA